MGLDGGTYITRSDVLRGQSWELNSAENSRSSRGGSVQGVHKKARLDPKTARLQPPLVADFLGNLYNREAVLEFFLGRGGHFADEQAEHRYFNQIRASGSTFDHLQAKRDVFSVVLENRGRSEEKHGRDAEGSDQYRCPVTDLLCETHPFSALSTCGHVFSDRAIQQMTEQICSVCSRPFSDDSIVPINGTPEQVKELQSRIVERQELARQKKLLKQRAAAIEGKSGTSLSRKLLVSSVLST